jgi:predicted small integral membrane protein
MPTPRNLKTVLVGAVAFYMSLVVLTNFADPGSNLQFVQHVFSMDTVFATSTQKWRAISNPILWRVGFASILLCEAAVALGLSWATFRMLCCSTEDWPRARHLASCALVATMLIWLVPFITIGGEWFQMWQSEQWSGIEPATRNFTVHGLILLYLQSSETC